VRIADVPASRLELDVAVLTQFEPQPYERLADLDQPAWRALYGDAGDAFDYLLACAPATPPSFQFSALAVVSDGRLAAGAPVFQTAISLDLVLDGVARWVVRQIGRVLPSIARVPLLGIGTPYAHDTHLAFQSGLTDPQRLQALASLLSGLESLAQSKQSAIVILKDIPADVMAWADASLAKHGYARITALPVARLRIPSSEAAYVQSLSGNMRSNLRRRLKLAQNIKVEVRTSADGIETELQDLRTNTLRRAATDYDVFEEVAPNYYSAILRGLGDKARLLTYWLDGKLIGFSLVVLGQKQLVQTYNGMRYPEGPDNGLFYLDWMTQIRLCIEHGIPQIHSGVTTYLIKARLGCDFHRTYIYVRHRQKLMNAITRRVCPYINLEAADASLKELGATAPFVTRST
jgi:uncharacterized protein